MNLIQIFKKFPTQDDCVAHLEAVRWGSKPACPYCGASRSTAMPTEDRHRHHCNACNRSFKVTIGTIFHGTHLPLQKWFLALALVLNAKKGLSSLQLARDIEVNKNTAWRMQMQIREAMASDQGALLSGIVEMDETYVGGKPRKGNDRGGDGASDKRKRGRGTSKTPVVGLAERGGRVKARAVRKGDLNAKFFADLVRKSVDVTSTLMMTDEFKPYAALDEFVARASVTHKVHYADGFAHVNSIEGFWAILKRGIIGSYHKVTTRHLNAYIAEFAWRYNNRRNVVAFDDLLALAVR